MKKLAVFLFLFASVVVLAEQVSFVTTMSSPLGVFSRLETAGNDSVTIPTINYCTEKGTDNVITVRTSGDIGATFGTVNFNNATLTDSTSNLINFKTPTVNIGTYGAMEVKRVVSNNVTPSNDATLVVSGTEKADAAVTTKALWANGVKVNSTTWFPNQANASGSGTAGWKDYTNTATCNTSGDCSGKTVLVLTTRDKAAGGSDVPENQSGCGESGGSSGSGSCTWGSAHTESPYYWGCGAIGLCTSANACSGRNSGPSNPSGSCACGSTASRCSATCDWNQNHGCYITLTSWSCSN